MMNSTFKLMTMAVAVCIATPSNSLGAETYAIDPAHTSIIFGINHLGYSFTYGRFNEVSGGFVWDNANPSAGQFQLIINAGSIDTNNAQRDEHLRGPDFFNARQFPDISFQSTSITPQPNAPGRFNVNGNLKIHGVTRQVTLPLQKLGEGDKSPDGKYRSGFICQTSLKRSDYGMNAMIPSIGDEVAVTICFEGIHQGAAGGSGSSGAKPGAGSATRGKSGTRGSGGR